MRVFRALGSLLLLAAAGCAAGEVSAPPTRTQDPTVRADAGPRDGRTDAAYRFDLPRGDLYPTWDTRRPTPDSRPRPDAARVDTTQLQPDLAPDAPPPTPRLVITEIMINPAAATDTKGEWFEIFNAGPPVNLKWWTIRDQHSDLHVVSVDVLVDAGGYAVIGRSSLTSENGGVTVAYDAGGNFQLANSGDEVILVDPSGDVMDQVYFDPADWPVPEGASISLTDPTLDNADPANWCVETDTWSGSAGDRGSPGAPGGC